MPLTYAELDKLKEEMKNLPEPPRDQITPNKQEAVKLLAGEIVVLQNRGFTIEQIASWLNGKGLELNAPTLKNYLSRAGVSRRRKKPGSSTEKRSANKIADKTADKVAAKIASKTADKVVSSEKTETTKKDPKAAFLANDKANY